MIELLKDKSKYNSFTPLQKKFFEMWFVGFKQICGGESFDSMDSSVKKEMYLEVEKTAYIMMDNMPPELLAIGKLNDISNILEQLNAISDALTKAKDIGIVYTPPTVK